MVLELEFGRFDGNENRNFFFNLIFAETPFPLQYPQRATSRVACDIIRLRVYGSRGVLLSVKGISGTGRSK